MRAAAVLTAGAALWLLVAPVPAPRPLRLPRVSARDAASVAGAAAAGFLVALGAGGVPIVAAAAALLGAAAAASARHGAARRAAAVAADRWPDYLAAVRARIAAGETLPEAAVAAARRVGGRFAGLADTIADAMRSGASFDDALAVARAEWADPIADRVLITFAAGSAAGGSRVGAVLARLAASVADEIRLHRAHEAALTQQRLTAGVALAAPWALLLLTTATNPQAADAYTTRAGTVIVLVGMAATGSGYWLARRAGRLSRRPRVFAG